MANLQVTLYIRIIHDGKRIQCKPVFAAKNRLKPLHAEGKGHHPEGEYYLRYAGKWEQVGNDPYVALDCLNARRNELRSGGARGKEPTPAEPSSAPKMESTARITVEAAMRDYLTTGKAAERDWRKQTLQCYALALKLFRESCKKTFLDEIGGGDLKAFQVFLRSQKTSIGKKIDKRTVYNHFLNVVSFLNTYGRRELIPQSEWPTYEEKKVVAYDPETLAHLLKFADEDEADVLEFFLGVNFRNGEGAHVEWPDINLRTKEVRVYSKEEKFGWQAPQLTADQIAQVSGLVAQYISTQREKYAPRAVRLSAQQKAAMDGFFSPGLLDGTLLLLLRGE